MGARARQAGGVTATSTISAKRVLATRNQVVSVKLGRDTLPARTDEVVAASGSGRPVVGHVVKYVRETLAPQRASVGVTGVTYGVPDKVDGSNGSFTETVDVTYDGVKIGKTTRVIRTEDMGEGVIVRPALRAEVEQVRTRKAAAGSNRSRRAEQREADTLRVTAYLLKQGYKGEITPEIRNLALDALAFEEQVREMGRK